MPATVTFTRYADVVQVLGDARFQVQPMPPPGPNVDLAWLRATVSRFSEGDAHARRRQLCQTELDLIAPAQLRAYAADLARTLPIEQIAVEVLATSLGVCEPLYEAVSCAAAGYLPGGDAGPAGDEAVRHLVAVFGGSPDELTAARIAVLMQACNANAALIANAVNAWRTWRPSASASQIVIETLRYDPPVPALRRVCVTSAQIGDEKVAVDDTVILDVTAANRDPSVFADPDRFDAARPDGHLTFGAGLRPCPGRDHSVAIAAGALETLMQKDRNGEHHDHIR